MAKKKSPSRRGAVVVLEPTITEYRGTITEVTNGGVNIECRPFGRQKEVAQFFPFNRLASYTSEEGPGFVFVREDAPLCTYYGDISEGDNGSLVVHTEEGTVINVPTTMGKVLCEFEEDGKRLDSITARAAVNWTSKWHTHARNASEKDKPAKKSSSKSTSKKVSGGKGKGKGKGPGKSRG